MPFGTLRIAKPLAASGGQKLLRVNEFDELDQYRVPLKKPKRMHLTQGEAESRKWRQNLI